MVIEQKRGVEKSIAEIDDRNGRKHTMLWFASVLLLLSSEVEYGRTGEVCEEENSESLLEWRSWVRASNFLEINISR